MEKRLIYPGDTKSIAYHVDSVASLTTEVKIDV